MSRPFARGLFRIPSLCLAFCCAPPIQGYNAQCQLGDGTKTNQYKPTRVITVPGQYAITSISAGFYHSCATAGDAAVMCWGRNK